MKEKIFVLIALCCFTFSNAQNCVAKDLSDVFDFNIRLLSKDKNNLGSAKIIIEIFDKRKALKTQTINLESESILKSESFKNCNNCKSYGSDKYLVSDENDFGDFIVADFNFDGKQDIAVKREEGGNGGPVYNFYIQSENQQFLLDDYLSNEMSYFPNYIDRKKKTLRVSVRVDTLTNQNITYSYKDKTWSIIERIKFRN